MRGLDVLLRRRATENLWLPCIEMRVEVNDFGSSIDRIDRSQQRQDDRMVSSESDDSWMRLATLGE